MTLDGVDQANFDRRIGQPGLAQASLEGGCQSCPVR
jgi:hypothetical protein